MAHERVEVAVAEPTQSAARKVVAYLIVSDDVERSRRFSTEVLGGRVVFGPEPTSVALEVGQTTDPPGDWWRADWPSSNGGGPHHGDGTVGA